MEPNISEKLDKLELKIEETRVLAQKTYRIFLWTMIATAIAFFLPLIGLLFAIPFFLRTLSSIGGL